MDKIIDKLIELMPLWAIIIIAIMFVAMKFYYTRFKVLEDKTKHADCQNRNEKTDRLVSDVGELKNDVSNLKNDVSNLKNDVGNLKNDVSNLKNDVSKLKEDMSDIKSDISAIKTVLIQKFPNAAIILSMKKSPRILNETGKWLFNQVNGEQFLNEHKEFFFSKIDDMKPLTALDVESAANYACAGYTDNPIFNDIKLYIYNAPSITIKNEEGKDKQYDLTLGDVCFALSIPLRDMYLNEHPEIPR